MHIIMWFQKDCCKTATQKQSQSVVHLTLHNVGTVFGNFILLHLTRQPTRQPSAPTIRLCQHSSIHPSIAQNIHSTCSESVIFLLHLVGKNPNVAINSDARKPEGVESLLPPTNILLSKDLVPGREGTIDPPTQLIEIFKVYVYSGKLLMTFANDSANSGNKV